MPGNRGEDLKGVEGVEGVELPGHSGRKFVVAAAR
jgi:hypothetical protein